jgi:hypothetical protein
MPIDSIVFENGIFYCREYDNLTAEDARLWSEKAEEFARAYAPMPIVALVDARDVKFEAMEARQILAQASGIEGLELAAVVTNSPITQQSARIIKALAVKKHTYLFPTMEEAKAFIEKNLPHIYAQAKAGK